MKKNPQITEQTKKNIVDAFWSVYQNKDISKITVTEVIKKAGYNRSTFYNYFPDIPSILDDIEDRIIDSFKKNLKSKSPYTEYNVTFIHHIFKEYECYGEYYRVLLSENGDPHFAAKFSKLIKPIFYRSLGNNQAYDFKLDVMFEFATRGILGAFYFWSTNPDKMSATQFFELTDYIMNNGTKETLHKYFDEKQEDPDEHFS